jgi:choline dehydrogenase
LNNQAFRYPAGKTLGGTSARNFMGYHRPTKGTFKKWAVEVGDTSYAFPEFLPYLKKSVCFTKPSAERLPADKFDESAFSKDGEPVQVSYPRYAQPLTEHVAKAFTSAGLTELNGLNSGKLLGFGHIPLTIDPKTGIRSSSESSFLQSALGRENLTVYLNTTANKVEFHGRKATGVAVQTGETRYLLKVNREVIVSSGTFRSPHLLLLSGIGNKADLEKLGIDVVADRQGVGQNLCVSETATLLQLQIVMPHRTIQSWRQSILLAATRYQDYKTQRLWIWPRSSLL